MQDDNKKVLRERVLQGFDFSEDISDESLKESIFKNINLLANEKFIPLSEREELNRLVYNSIRGWDVLEDALNDPKVTEIMVNGANDLFVEKEGKLFRWDRTFESEEKLADIIQQIAGGANRMVNEASPIADARLPDGSRVSIVLPPVAINGPIVTIRKFSDKPFTMDMLIELGTITEEAAVLLSKLVKARYNIFISGGTGSGKTTFLNALSCYINPDERVITIEDSAELRLFGIANIVRLEVRNRNAGDCREISIRDLIRASLRMRPDRIVVGEVRGAEVPDMLSAMSTGHDGSLSTGHGNSVPDMLDRLEMLTMLGGNDIPLRAVRKQIASAIDIMIHLGRLRDGSRKVLEISEVLGVSDGEIELNPLFVFQENERKEGGRLVRTGNGLICRGKLNRAGISLDEEQV